MDASRIHLFDPETGRNLTVDTDNAGTLPELTQAST